MVPAPGHLGKGALKSTTTGSIVGNGDWLRQRSFRFSWLARSARAASARLSGNCRRSARLARASEPEAQTAHATVNVGTIAKASPIPSDAALAKRADSRKPLMAPHPAKRGSDN